MSIANKTPDYASLRAFLSGRKSASANGKAASHDPPSADSTIPAEDGAKAPDTGARFSENSSDLKEVTPVGNVESAAGNEAMGNAADPVPGSGLEQTTAGQDDSQVRAVKKIHGETEKIAGLDLTKDADLATALEALQKAAAALPELLTPVAPAPGPTAPTGASPAWHAEQQATANTVAAYRKMGADRGRIAAAYLRGHEDTLALLKAAADDGTMAQMLQGAADPAAGGAAPEGAEMPPATPPMPPEAAAAGAPGDAGGGDAGGGQITPDDLAAAFAEAGITPEEFLQMLEAMKGQLGAGGAAPGGDAGADMPPDMKEKAAAAIAHGEKIAHDVAAHMRSGKFSFKPAADGTPSRKSRDTAKAYLAELRAVAAA